jgi:hypothetical protein
MGKFSRILSVCTYRKNVPRLSSVLLPVDFRNLYFRAINVNLNLLINFPAIMQYILLVYVQVGDPFACLSNNLRSQQSLSFIAVMQMVSLQPPGEKGVQVELQLLQAV